MSPREVGRAGLQVCLVVDGHALGDARRAGSEKNLGDCRPLLIAFDRLRRGNLGRDAAL